MQLDAVVREIHLTLHMANVRFFKLLRLKHCNEKEVDILARRFRDTVGSIIVLFNSLSTVVLARLSPALSETISITLDPLKSVLNVPEDRNTSIQLLYSSFRDFLINKDRCLDRHFWIDQGKAHHDIAKHCLCVISKTLKRNIYRLRTPQRDSSVHNPR